MIRQAPVIPVALAFLLTVAPLSLAREIVNFDIHKRSCVAHDESNWGYYGQLSGGAEDTGGEILLPDNWGLRYEACGRQLAPLHRQSPIVLSDADALAAGEADSVSYTWLTGAQVSVEHNCHTVQATVINTEQQREGALIIDGQAYHLLQFHLHTPSEHVLQGRAGGTVNYPGELHFVHAAITDSGELDDSRLAVLGVFLAITEEEGKSHADEFFHALARDYSATRSTGETSGPITVNLSTLQGGTGRYWRYRGSLTTPPCTESVEWVVLADPLKLHTATYREIEQSKLDVGIANTRPPFLPTASHNLRFISR
jgi:carbonic anhydrase